jgi:DNA-binding MarR family transcriptional regulator
VLAQWRQERPDLDRSGMAVAGRIARAASLLQDAIEEELGKHGLTGPEFDVLAALRRSGPPHRLTPTELYRSMMVSSGTVTRRLDTLERRGLVRRRPAGHDRRSIEVELTPEGKRLADTAVEAHTANQRRLLAGLTKQDRAALEHGLRNLLLSLEADSPPTPSGPAA